MQRLIFKLKSFIKGLWVQLKDIKTLIIFLIVLAVMYFPAYGFYILSIIFKSTSLAAIATAYAAFWAGPFTPFFPLCISITLGIKALLNKKNKHKSLKEGINMSLELWDSYNSQGQKLGFDLVRGDKIPLDVYHLVVDIIVIHKSDHSYLLLQRDFNKISNPGLWEIGAGGAAIKGEEPLEAALRELKEESGIAGHNLKEIYDTIYYQGQSLHVGYECITDINKKDILLQETETISYKWITPQELIKFYHSNNCIRSQKVLLKDYMEGIELIYNH